MANRKVAIVRSIKLEGRWHHTRPIVTSKGRKERELVSPDYVKLRGEKFLVPMGTPTKWRIMFYQGSRQIWKPCESRADAIAQKDQQEARLALRAVGGEAPEERHRLSLQSLASEFLDEARLRRVDKDTLQGYTIVVKEFVKLAGRSFAEDIVHKDVLRYIDALQDPKREGGQLSKRTANNRGVVLRSFLRFCKMDVKALVQKKDLPRYNKRRPESYSVEEMKAIMAAARNYGSERLTLAIETAAKTGMRKMEIANLEWSVVNFEKRSIHLASRETEDETEFQIKDKEDRPGIRLEAGLVKKLKIWRKKHLKTRLVFGTSGDLPDYKMLEKMKAACKKAGVKVAGRLYFHKFRSSFMSHMQGKVKLATLMDMSGHSDLKSVQRYLAVDEKEKLVALDEVFGDLG